jgi:hypothetical protein
VALADLTSRDAVLAAMEEFDKLGRDQFLERYHFRRARDYESSTVGSAMTPRRSWVQPTGTSIRRSAHCDGMTSTADNPPFGS